MISLLLPNHQVVLDRFVTACQVDRRVVAAFLAGQEKFICLLGEPLFLEDFGLPQAFFYIFSDPAVGEEPYFKVDQALPIEQISPLKETYCPMEYGAMLQAAFVIFRYYQGLALTLAKSHGIKYQMKLERMMLHQLEKLDKASLI